jgi:uncharacterized protein YidB (DUF937 family)
MGLFDSIASQAAGALLGQHGVTPAAAPAGMMDVVQGLLGHAGGGAAGLQALVGAFSAQGLGGVIQSWIGSGHNLPISAEQIRAVLGNAQVQAIAHQLGLPVDGALQALSQFLPPAIDTLTPNGQLVDSHLMEQGLSLFKGLTGRG